MSAKPNLASNPFGALAIGLVSKLVESMVDSYVTPSGLAGLAQGRTAEAGSTSDSSSLHQSEQPFARGRLDRESFERFSVWEPTDSGKEVRFVFRRYGLRW